MGELDDDTFGERYILNTKNLEKAKRGEHIGQKKVKKVVNTNDAQFNAAMPFPKPGQLDYKEKKERVMSEKEKLKRPTNIKTMIKNLGLKIDQD